MEFTAESMRAKTAEARGALAAERVKRRIDVMAADGYNCAYFKVWELPHAARVGLVAAGFAVEVCGEQVRVEW